MLATNIWNLNLREPIGSRLAGYEEKGRKNNPHRKTRVLFSWIKRTPARTGSAPWLGGGGGGLAARTTCLYLAARKVILGNAPCCSHSGCQGLSHQCRATVQRTVTSEALEAIKVFILATVTRNETTLVTLKLGSFKRGPQKRTSTINWGLQLFLFALKKQKASPWSSHLDFEKKNKWK